MYPPIKHPSSGILVGPSLSGKTELTLQILNNLSTFYDRPIRRVHWYYSDGKSLPDRSRLPENVDVQFINKLPTEFLNEMDEPLLVVIDDMMDEAMNSLAVSQLHTKGVHHQMISSLLLTQNIFNAGKYSRNISLNSTFYILFRNLRDMQQTNKFFQQMCGSNSKAIQAVYKDATQKPHSFLFVDFSQAGHNLMRLRSDIFGKQVCYCPANELNSSNGIAYIKKTKCGEIYATHIK